MSGEGLGLQQVGREAVYEKVAASIIARVLDEAETESTEALADAIGERLASAGFFRWIRPDTSMPDVEPPTKRDERRLADLRAANAAVERALVAQGARLNELAVLQLQVRTLQRILVGDDPGWQLAYDLAYQEVVAEGLAEVSADLDRRRLSEGTGRILVPRPGGAG